MLMLLFNLGDSQYAIPVTEVVEVTPGVALEQIAQAPEFIAGLFNYRGQHVPVIDLCRLFHNTSCSDSFTTRIILVNFTTNGADTRLLGLLAERVTDAVEIDETAFNSTGISMEDAPYLGTAANTAQGLLQQVSTAELLPAHVKTMLFPDAAV